MLPSYSVLEPSIVLWHDEQVRNNGMLKCEQILSLVFSEQTCIKHVLPKTRQVHVISWRILAGVLQVPGIGKP